MRALFLSLRISFMMLCAPVITMACEIRRPWWVRKDRVARVYLVLSLVVNLAAVQASCTRKRAPCGAKHGRRQRRGGRVHRLAVDSSFSVFPEPWAPAKLKRSTRSTYRHPYGRVHGDCFV